MSAQTTPIPPYQFYPSYPYGYDHNISTIQEQILAAVSGNAEQTKQQAANDIARDILRSVENNGHMGTHVTERTASQLATAIERNGSNNMSTTERVNSQLATAVERNGANAMSTTERVNSQLATAVERNGATNLSAIERVAGENRLTTVVTDAASRQSANDSARDILRAVDHNGNTNMITTKDAYNGILSSVERNSGETRLATAIGQGVTDSKLTDVRHSILNDVNRSASEILAASTQSLNVLTKHVTDGAWEARTSMASGFQQLGEEHLRTKFDLAKNQDTHYASMLLEQQKMSQYLASKSDNHFAVNQLEMQKVKEGLASQAAQHFASTQLEAQKNREAIQMQLADAKYEALKSQQFLADKICECCCSMKEKVDNIDRDRLRDNLTVSRDKNSIYESIEFQQLFWGGNRLGGPGFGYGGFPGYGPYPFPGPYPGPFPVPPGPPGPPH